MKIIEERKTGLGRRVHTENNEPSMTDQSWADIVNVNSIIAKYHKTGQINHLAKKQGSFADVSELKDLQTSVQKVQRAQEAFASLPANIRARFQNNPLEFVSFMQNPNNIDEAIKLGILKKSEVIEDEPQPQPKQKAIKKQSAIQLENDDD